MPDSPSSKTPVYAALVGNFLVAATKAGAAAWTGSSAMWSEAVHSLVDTGNELLLLYGMHRSTLRADRVHPIGYGRELYFWSFIVALLVFALGASVSIYQGVLHVLNPQPVTDPIVNYIVLGLSLVFEGASWLVSLRQFNAAKGDLSYYQAFRRSKDPPSFMVLFEDTAALIGIVIAALGTFAATTLGQPMYDGVASIAIGVVLAATSMLLARESKSLLIGERADTRLADAILRLAAEQPAVRRANGVLTVQLAPDQILAALSVEFDSSIRASEVEAAVSAIERSVCAAHREVVTLFVKPQSGRTYREALRRRFGDDDSDETD